MPFETFEISPLLACNPDSGAQRGKLAHSIRVEYVPSTASPEKGLAPGPSSPTHDI